VSLFRAIEILLLIIRKYFEITWNKQLIYDQTDTEAIYTSTSIPVVESSTTFETQRPIESLPSAVNSKVDERIPTKGLSLVDRATPLANVSAFCCAVLSRVVPAEFWGIGDVQKHNLRLFLQNVDRFVKLRRFETLTLHDIFQGMKVQVGFL
jgi:hypothetical protein